LTVDDNGLLTVSGATFTMDQLIIDSDNTEAVLIRKDGDAGDVFIVDTVNDVVRLGSNDTFLTFGASSDARLEWAAPRTLRMREPGVGGVGLGAGGENTLQIYARDDVSAARFLELTGDGPRALVKANRSAGGGQFDLNFDVNVGRLAFFNEGVQRWNIQGSVTGDFEFTPFITDRYDLGSATFAVRNLYTNGVLIGQDKTSAYDAITIDGTDLAAPGQQDSGAIILTGLSNDGSAHDIDWKFFVDVTANDGTGSIWTLQTRIDAAGFATVFQIDDAGNLTIPGSFTVDGLIIDVDSTEAFLVRKDGDAGDVFTIDTVNEVVMLSSAASLNWSTDLKLFRDGPWELALRDGTNDNFLYIYATFTDSSNYERLALYAGGQANFFIETQTAGTGQDDAILDIRAAGSGGQILLKPGASSVTFIITGTNVRINPTNVLDFGLAGSGYFRNAYFGTSVTSGLGVTTGDAYILDTATLNSPGVRDSLSVLWTGKSNDGSPHDVDWRAFVEATNNDGTGSLWKLATRIDAAGFADVLEIDDAGSFHIIQQGPHSFGGPLSGFTRFKVSGSFISDGTGSQMEGFSVQGPIQGALGDNIGLFGQEINVQITTQTDGTAQNMGDIAALNVLEPQITDNMTGNITRAATVRINSMPTEGVENTGLFLERASQKIDVNNTEAFLVRKFPDAGDIFTVDTTNETVKSNAKLHVFVNDSQAFFIQKAGGGGPGQDIFVVDTSASGFPPGNMVRLTGALFRQEISQAGNTFGTTGGLDYVFLRIAPSQVISRGGSDEAHILLVEGNVQGFSGDTARINVATFTGSVTSQNVAEAITNMSQVQIDEPSINLQGSSTVTDAQSLLITGAPTEGDNNYALRILGGDVQLPSAGALQWSTDLKLFRDGPWELALRDGTNDNFFYVYGTFTDSSNYERLALYAGSSILYVLEPQSAGSGNNTINMAVRALGGGSLTLGSADNSDGWIARGFNFSFFKGSPEARTLIDLNQRLLTSLVGASVTTVSLIPAGCMVIGVTVRVETTITGPATFSIGDGVDVDRWGAGIPVAAGTRTDISDFTSTTISLNLAGAANATITSDGVDFTGGDVRVVVHYMQLFAPTTS
jgi:hypothetical protein